jgi:hypothetical protein
MIYDDLEDRVRAGDADMFIVSQNCRTISHKGIKYTFVFEDGAWRLDKSEEGVHTMQPDYVVGAMSAEEKEYNRQAIVQSHSLLARMIKNGAEVCFEKSNGKIKIKAPIRDTPGGWRITEDHVLVECVMRAAIKDGLITEAQAYGNVEAKTPPTTVDTTTAPSQCGKCGWLNGKHAPTCWGSHNY